MYGLQEHRLFHAKLYSGATFFLAGPTVGAPMAALTLEKLIALGARKVVVYGWCGSLHASLQPGALFSPTGVGMCEEGTSAHYPLNDPYYDEEWHSLLVRVLTNAGHQVSQGLIWTTDALYRETRQKVVQYSARGILAVDMEYTALRTVAAYRRISLAAVMKVSDALFLENWVPRFQLKRFQADSRRQLGQLCVFLQEGELA
ncbi:nucleoside phosphorylase [Desulfobulbus oligotrophicus]|uniref:nucleoside phosphorylase n=1 Tax=Desulfobulbus oligotrophicus TaxID=1909699 RepID=UPI0022B916AE|nr:nucleoside phosphorylase [Desulfobulbus oligotrophicus]